MLRGWGWLQDSRPASENSDFCGVWDLLQSTQLLSGREATAARAPESKKTVGAAVFFYSALLPLWQPWSPLPLLQAACDN